MRRIILIALCLLAIQLHAQRVSQSFSNVAMPEALRQLGQLSADYTIYFLYNDLEDFRITTTIRHKLLPDAIRQMIGFYPIDMTIDESDPSEKKIFVECSQKTARRYKGRVVDAGGRPIEFANVALLSPEDSTLLAGGVTNASGYFVIPCETPSVLVRVSYVGYKKAERLCSSTSIGTVRLFADHIALKGVTVKAQQPQYKMTRGGMTIDVEHSVLSQMGTAADVLAQLPRVSVDGGKVEVFAKGTPLIYINNRKMSNSSALKELKSEEIKSVDVITTPGSQYDATARSVIRIRTKKALADGFSFRNDVNVKYLGMWMGYEQTKLKYRWHGIEVSNRLYWARTGYNEHVHKLDYSLNSQGHKTDIHQSTLVTGPATGISERMDLSYDINDSNSIGASYRYYASLSGDVDFDGHQSIIRDSIAEGEIHQLQHQSRRAVPQQEVNVYYAGHVGPWQIDFNGSYLFTKLNEHGHATENSATLDDRVVTTKGLQRSRLWAGKLVLAHNVGHGTLSFGSEYTHTTARGLYLNAEGYVSNSDTKQTESNIALFADYGLPLGCWRVDAGLRYEHVASNYYSCGQREDEPSRNYHHLFPTLSLSWDKRPWALQLGYSLTTERPTYRNLRNYLQYDSRYLFEGGNPYLRPAYTHNIDLSVVRGWLTASVGYNYTKDVMTWMFSIMDDREAIVNQTRNLNHSQSVYASVSASPKFGIYQPMAEATYGQQWQNSLKLPVNLSKPAFSFRLNNRFVVSKSFMAYANLRAYTHFYDLTVSAKGFFDLALGMRKSFFTDRLVLNLAATDLLKTRHERWTAYGIGVRSSKDAYNAYRTISLTVTYNFNATRSRYKGTGAGNEERKRL